MGRVPRSARYAVAGSYAVFVLYSSVVDPRGGVPPGGLLGIGVDKWLHLATYATLALLLAFAGLARPPRALALVVAVTVAYGAGIEVVQAFLPVRTFDLADAVANAVGALVGTGAWRTAVALRDADR